MSAAAWKCSPCDLRAAAESIAEAALLAGVHDQVHHRGAVTAVVHLAVAT